MAEFKYDLYVSIGEACSCSLTLRNAKLQFYSYPLDWVSGADITERAKFFKNNFENYIDKQDLIYAGEDRSAFCKAYHNTKNKITFNHDFKNDVDFDEMYPKVLEKYKRRAERVIRQIKESEKVMFVYIQSPDNPQKMSDEKLIEVQKSLKETFPEVKTDLLYLFCEKGIKFNKMKKKVISENIKELIFDYDGRNPKLTYVVNSKILDKVFRHFSITKKHLTEDNIEDMKKYKNKMFWRGKLLINPLT